MGSNKNKKLSISSIYSNTFDTISKNRVVLLPYLIFACFEFISLAVFYFSPRMPLKALLGPPIRTFWGEQFLHFPFNFLLLAKLVSNAKIVLVVVVGSLLTAMAVILFAEAYQKKPLAKFSKAMVMAARKYLGIFLIFAFISFAYYFLDKFASKSLVKYFMSHQKLLFMGPGIWLGPVQVALSIFIGILVQLPFAFTVPLLVLGNQKFFKAVSGSFKLVKALFFQALALSILPILVYLPMVILNFNIPFLMDKLFPEVVVLLLAVSIAISTLILDPVMTFSITALYLAHKEQK